MALFYHDLSQRLPPSAQGTVQSRRPNASTLALLPASGSVATVNRSPGLYGSPSSTNDAMTKPKRSGPVLSLQDQPTRRLSRNVETKYLDDAKRDSSSKGFHQLTPRTPRRTNSIHGGELQDWLRETGRHRNPKTRIHDFEPELKSSRPYRRIELGHSDSVFSLKETHSTSWSCLSGLSLADISDVSVISLAITLSEVYKPAYYTTSRISSFHQQPEGTTSGVAYIPNLQCKTQVTRLLS